MKYNPYTHIIGKVYDLTQENMNALLDEIDKLNLKLKELHSDSLEDYQEYKRATNQLIKDLRDENETLKNQISDVRSCLLQITSLQERIQNVSKLFEK